MKENKLNILQLIDSLHPGGAEMMAVNIANGLSDVGINSHICTTRLEGALRSKINASVGYLCLNKKKTFDFQAIRKLIAYVKKHKITLVHAHSSSFFLATVLKLVVPSTRIVWHDHFGESTNLKQRKSTVLKVCSLFFYSILAVKKDLYIWSQQKLYAKNIILMPNFAEISSTNSNITKLKGITGKRIVCLANLRPQKDHLNLLTAFEKLNKKYKDWSLHLVGFDFEDAYSEELKAFVKENKLSDSVFFYSNCTDIAYILSQSTIGVLASKSEGLPLALLEYGLAGLPVVVTNVGDCGIVVTTNENGFLVPSKDAVQLASRVMELIENETLRVQFGQKLKERIQTNFSKENYIKKLLEVYH